MDTNCNSVMASIEAGWDVVADRIRLGLGNVVFDAWFARIQIVDISDTRVTLSVPTVFLKSWLLSRYQADLLAASRLVWPQVGCVSILVRTGVKLRLVAAVCEVSKMPEPVQEKPVPSCVVARVEVVHNSLEPVPKKIAEIMRVVCAQYGVTQADMVSSDRRPGVVKARHVAMYLARALTVFSLPNIGRRFGGRDHTTVMHAVQKIKLDMDKSNVVNAEVMGLTSGLSATFNRTM